MLSESKTLCEAVSKRYSSKFLRAASQRFDCTCLTRPGDGWCARWPLAPAPAWHCQPAQAASSNASKSPPTSCAVRTRPAKPLGELFCGSADFVPDPAAVDPLGLVARRTSAVRGLWKVSDGEDNEGTCLRCRRRGARNRSGQACRQTEDSSQGLAL